MSIILCTVGVLLLGYAVFNYTNFYRLRDVIYYPNFINRTEFPFTLSKDRLYSISFVGGKFINLKGNYKVEIFDSNGFIIAYKKNLILSRFLYKGKTSIEAFRFNGSEGDYTLHIKNGQNLDIKGTRLISRQLIEGEFNINAVGLLIRETIDPKKKVLMKIALISGLLFLNFGLAFPWK
jgi:hypothetical protein